VLLFGRQAPFVEDLEEACEREERCLELVRSVGDEVAPRALELRLGGDVAQDDDEGEVGLVSRRVRHGLKRALTLDEDHVLDLAALPRRVPDVGDVEGEGATELGADRQVASEESRRCGVGDGDTALGRDADDTLAQVVQQDLDAVLLELDLGECVAQTLGHDVERTGELPYLIFETDRHRHAEVASGDRLGARLDPFETAGDEGRHEQAGGQADEQRQSGSKEELVLDTGHRLVDVVQWGE